MVLVLQILLLLLLLVGLITTAMSIKNWHWAQMVLLLGIVLFGAFALVLTAEVLRVHRLQRQGIAKLELEVASVKTENEALRSGTRDTAVANRLFPEKIPFDLEAEGRMPSMDVWTRRLQVMASQRGRVWRNVRGGQVDAKSGKLLVEIAQPKPHSLDADAIIYLFEEGEPNAATPPQGAQYLGEFRVTALSEGGAELQAVSPLDQRTGNRINQSQSKWSLYETLPADRYELFAGRSEEELSRMLPAASVNEYLRHGSPATDDDDEFHRAGYDENGRRLGPDDAAKAVEFRYDRTLRDYSSLFVSLLRQRVLLLADFDALTEDINKLKSAHVIAEKLEAYREQEKGALTGDLERMKRDRTAAEQLRDAVSTQLKNARELIAQAIQYNAELAQLLN